ncbi:MAG: Uncharacterized protein Athens071425_612 [Parcubacteria group bacterium Athens0714_25]|nr:MAG: Uncharacterized protein Athens071425_612 [Parcubacteria group bacterium Athens0714_25]
MNFFPIETAQAGVISDAPALMQVGGNFLSFLLSIFGVLAIMSLIVAGMLYFFSSGEQTQVEKAKKMAFYSVIGIAVALGALLVIRQISVLFS